jgi:hypothetical protein
VPGYALNFTERRVKNMPGFTLGRKELVNLRLKALRSGVWFKALKRIDRALVDLTLKVSDEVHSQTLVKALLSVAVRVQNALRNRSSRAVDEVGFRLARQLSLIAERMGNAAAKTWRTDPSFAKFLAIMYINNHAGTSP